jgi:uncharacterized membrane-anchored protein
VTIVNIDFHVNTGYRKLQRDASVAAGMLEVLEQVKANAGEGFEVDLDESSGRRNVPRGSVRTATTAARVRQAREHVLERALDI